MDPDALRLALEELRKEFRRSGGLTATMFHAPLQERVLQLPNASAQALRGLSQVGSPPTKTAVASSSIAARVFFLQGKSQHVKAFERSAIRAGTILGKVGQLEVMGLRDATPPHLVRWLWFVFDLALNATLPSISITRRLWSRVGAQGIPSHRWTAGDLERVAQQHDPNRRFPEGAEYWQLRLQDHYCIEMNDLSIASAEATYDLLGYQKSRGTVLRESNEPTAHEPQRKQTREEREDSAMVLLVQHPEWKSRKIAKEVGVHPSTLSRYVRFQKLRQTMRKTGRVPRGFKKDGGIEAISEQD